MAKRTITAILAAATMVGVGACAPKDPNSAKVRAKTNIVGDPVDDFGTKKDPEIAASTHLAAGQMSENQGDLAAAVEQYEKTLAIDPKQPRAWYLLAALRARMGQYDASITAWQRYLKLVGNDAAAYANMGFTYDLADRFSDAEAAYKQAIAIDPMHKATRVNYGLMLAKAGQIDAATSHFAAVLPPAAVQYNLASFHEQQGDIDAARVAYSAALKIDPNFRDAKVRLAALPTTRPVTQQSASGE
ncbi:MAG TPA: tetratricopeptide repeat protein [Tepidisphaeraceae bacterium]|jgi:tetratricopeptide (TPR) repeat protein|nr:tetratricopeptide repeat protein [Tepidisphaeraceae bacterium]